MATTTTNLGLTKPAGTDAVDIAVINANMDTIDTNLSKKTDLASTASGKGASLIGIQDSAGKITATTVEGALAELVTVTGSDADQYYVKYPDGTMIATDSKSATVNCSTAWGGIYTTGTNTFVFDNFAVPFISAPIMSYGGGRSGGTGDFFIVTDLNKPPTATSPGGVQIARGTVNASMVANISYTAIGRWKA